MPTPANPIASIVPARPRGQFGIWQNPGTGQVAVEPIELNTVPAGFTTLQGKVTATCAEEALAEWHRQLAEDPPKTWIVEAHERSGDENCRSQFAVFKLTQSFLGFLRDRAMTLHETQSEMRNYPDFSVRDPDLLSVRFYAPPKFAMFDSEQYAGQWEIHVSDGKCIVFHASSEEDCETAGIDINDLISGFMDQPADVVKVHARDGFMEKLMNSISNCIELNDERLPKPATRETLEAGVEACIEKLDAIDAANTLRAHPTGPGR